MYPESANSIGMVLLPSATALSSADMELCCDEPIEVPSTELLNRIIALSGLSRRPVATTKQ